MIRLLVGILISISLSFATDKISFTKEQRYQMDFNKKTICLVRHLKVYKNPKWVSKIELKSGKKVFFSSPKSMFEFYYRPGKWYDVGVKSENDFKDIIVTDYMTMKLLDATKAYYVYGSRAISPAGDDLPAFKTYESANQFAKKYNGKRIFKFTEVSDALIRLINGRI